MERKAANAANQEGAEEDHHGSTMASAEAMSNRQQLALSGYLAHLGLGRQGECILQAEGDHRFGRNRQIAVSGKCCAQGSRTASGQAADEQAHTAGRHPSNQHAHARTATDEGCAAPAFAFLGLGPELPVSMRYWVPLTSNRVSVSAITDFPLNIPRRWATRTSPVAAEPAGHGDGIACHHRLGQDPGKPVAGRACLTSMVWFKRTSNRVPRGRISAGSGAGAGIGA